MKIYLVLILTVLSFQSCFTFAASKVAKAIITRGNVKAVLADGSTVVIKKGTWLDEGAQVKTAKKSFVKFLFTDKSQMNLGPDSEMKIAKFSKKSTGIITLMKGSLRSKVTKNYLDKKNNNKSKLFIRTKTAAMGVRGTDFMVTFDPRNNFTTLDVISGAVAMAPININDLPRAITPRFLEKKVSGKAAVMVKKGQFSNAASGMKKANIPKSIPKVKLQKFIKMVIPTTSHSKNPFEIGGRPVGGKLKELSKNNDNLNGSRLITTADEKRGDEFNKEDTPFGDNDKPKGKEGDKDPKRQTAGRGLASIDEKAPDGKDLENGLAGDANTGNENMELPGNIDICKENPAICENADIGAGGDVDCSANPGACVTQPDLPPPGGDCKDCGMAGTPPPIIAGGDQPRGEDPPFQNPCDLDPASCEQAQNDHIDDIQQQDQCVIDPPSCNGGGTRTNVHVEITVGD